MRMCIYTNFPNLLCSISTRQLELLLWRAEMTAKHLQDYPVLFIQLNDVYKSKQNKVLPPYVRLPFHKVAPGILLPLNQFVMSGLDMRPLLTLLLNTSGLKLRPSCIHSL